MIFFLSIPLTGTPMTTADASSSFVSRPTYFW